MFDDFKSLLKKNLPTEHISSGRYKSTEVYKILHKKTPSWSCMSITCTKFHNDSLKTAFTILLCTYIKLAVAKSKFVYKKLMEQTDLLTCATWRNDKMYQV